jgi:hypothetical protein
MIVIDEKLDLMKVFKNNKLCNQIYDIIALHFNLNKWVRCEGTFNKITFIVVGNGDYNYDAKIVIISNMGVITCNNIKFENAESINKLLKPYWIKIHYNPISELNEIKNNLKMIEENEILNIELNLVEFEYEIAVKFPELRMHIRRSILAIDDIIKTVEEENKNE